MSGTAGRPAVHGGEDVTIAGVSGATRRPPLDADGLRAALVRPGGLWRDVRVVTQTGSTNADLLTEAAAGAPEGMVLAAEAQHAGRGRMGRQWVSPPRAALTFSVLLRPLGVPPPGRGWLPLLAGVAVASAVRAQAAVAAWLKWPNDVLVGGAKLAGILAEQAGDAIVIGTGINVSTTGEEFARWKVGDGSQPGSGQAGGRGPSPGRPTSLALEGAASTDRARLLAAILAELERWYLAWTGMLGDAAGCGLRREYQRMCDTRDRRVRVSLPGGTIITGVAREVDDAGRLVVSSDAGLVPVSAGDVLYVR